MADRKEIYWHLPGFCINFYLYQILLNLMKEYPDKFIEGYKVGSVYGTFPGAIWNGGRTVLGTSNMSTIKSVLDTYERLGAPVRFTWTNSLIEEKHVNDTYCNLIMDIANNGKNQVLVNSKPLEEYLPILSSFLLPQKEFVLWRPWRRNLKRISLWRFWIMI